ncbi:MAG: hypothetical protein SVY53_06175, partial [Chloroflexota bacterium]|nr:hypothetical protein [Chloroflexota bacterium]
EGWTKKTILNLSKGLLRSGNQHERLLLEYALTGRRIFRLISDIEFIWPYPNLNQNFFGLISAIHSVFALRKTILRRVRWI